VVPFAAGGSTDVIGRILAERMRVSLGQTVIIENVAGAGGTLGVGRAVRAAPDGYTISLGQNGSHVITGATYSNLSYDLLTDFEPVSLLVISPFVIAANRKSVPPSNLQELIAWLKANPGKVTIGNAGQGSITHVAGLVFQDATGTKLQSVPYRGTGPAMQDLVAGQIDMMISDPITAMPQAREGGAIKVYAVASGTRNRRVGVADRVVAPFVKRVVRQSALADVGPAIVVAPVGERVRLPQLVRGVPAELRRVRACR
jgi:tripartite-type tricarboxylate transporter receptor subunit TctC